MMITGGCGFIGSNFIRYMLKESDFTGRIINVDKLTYAGNPENLTDIEDNFKDRYVLSKPIYVMRRRLLRYSKHTKSIAYVISLLNLMWTDLL